MKNNKHTLAAEIMGIFDQASEMLSDYHFADDGCDYWWCRYKSREFEAGAEVAPTLIDGDTFESEHGRTMITEYLRWYRKFLDEHGYEFTCMKLDIVIRRVEDADVTVPEMKNVRTRH